MKHCFYLLIFFSSVTNAQVSDIRADLNSAFFPSIINAQAKDIRADLEIQGGIADLEVAPDEKIGLVSTAGNMYFAENINSTWHDCQNGFFGMGYAEINSISFFNKDTAIITGNEFDQDSKTVPACYWTGNGGATWQKRTVPGYLCLYKGCVDEKGNAWTVDRSGTIFFSQDFGSTWKGIDTSAPYSVMVSMDMVNPLEGVAADVKNKIYTTGNNWKSYDSLPTPCDEKKYPCDDPPLRGGINKVEMWGKYIVVNQAGHIFYTEKGNAGWKTFPADIIDFEVDKEAQQLFAITRSLNILSFSDPQKFRLVSNKTLSDIGIRSFFRSSLKVVNHSLYLLWGGHNLYKINHSNFIHTEPYTTDYKIKTPGIIKRAGSLCVGTEGEGIYTSGNRGSIYRSSNNGIDWYREKAVDFNIFDISILNDSSLILWSGDRNYLYSLTSHTLSEYTPEHPFRPFLKYPVNTITLQVSCIGHASGLGDKVVYVKDANTDSFSVSVINGYTPGYRQEYKKADTTVRNKISPNALLARLNYINNNPTAIPTVNDFHISDFDRKEYLKSVDERQNNNGEYWPGRKPNKEFYDALPASLDTVSAATIKRTLNWKDARSTTSCTLIIDIINENKDTIELTNQNDAKAAPWRLPWQCHYSGLTFNCYDAGLSAFIKYCKPAEYNANEIYNNSYLIMEIADYLYNQQ